MGERPREHRPPASATRAMDDGGLLPGGHVADEMPQEQPPFRDARRQTQRHFFVRYQRRFPHNGQRRTSWSQSVELIGYVSATARSSRAARPIADSRSSWYVMIEPCPSLSKVCSEI